MLNLLPSEICGFIPGVKPVQIITPYQEATDGETTYSRYTDGKVVCTIKNVPTLVERPQEIFKTTLETVDGETVTTRYHAKGLWENRKTLDYVPICVPLDANALRASPRMF